jgi:hypothetical protein
MGEARPCKPNSGFRCTTAVIAKYSYRACLPAGRHRPAKPFPFANAQGRGTLDRFSPLFV